MPKKIDDLNNKIFEVAWILFCEKGYENVDMKGIAKGCNIAVGTLYNYFSNKKVLFEEVLSKSWEETLEKISNRVLEGNKETLKRDVIEILYYDIKKRKGIGINFLYSPEELDNSINNITEKIVVILKPIFSEGITLKNIEKALALVICNIVIMVHKYPNDDEENVDIISSFFNA